MLNTKKVDIIVPCYNEEDVLELFHSATQKVLGTIDGYDFRYIFVDDGSKDQTLGIMKTLASKYDNVKYLSFSRNFGKESAMYAGLKFSSGDLVVIIDADLQHPPAMIPAMLIELENGYDSCAARRISRTGESQVRSAFSSLFYKLNNKLSDVELVSGAVDFRIMTRQVVDAVLDLCEVQRFSKGIFSWIGFETKWMPYENIERSIGVTKWSFKSLVRYAIHGITAFSTAPLRLVMGMGFVISMFAFVYIIITLVKTLVTGIDVPGYVTTLSAVLFLGGIIVISIGILGEYIGHIFMESKKRPIYILKQTNLNSQNNRGTGNEQTERKDIQ
ncbi:MAG: Glycosyl transferase, group 2 family [Clostridiales bacterium 38_11]|nr:MAG: Glycosyl transferase, group 2 family [Clostridiales bacterium 38_11]HBH11803.1 glycosyltransferase [Clostridiales bacterium]